MNALLSPSNLAPNNDQILEDLLWAIEMSQGEFKLILANCNYASLRSHLMAQLREQCPHLCEIVLDPSSEKLYTTIRERTQHQAPSVVVVWGLELVENVNKLLISTNEVREEFRKTCPFPLILWVNDELLRTLTRIAPDFESWATHAAFDLESDRILEELRQQANTLWSRLLAQGTDRFIPNDALFGISHRTDIRIALQALRERERTLDLELQASLDFALGRDDYAQDDLAAALERYAHSLAYCSQTQNLERQGIVLFHVGLCYCRQAERARTQPCALRQYCHQASPADPPICSCWQEARRNLQQSFEVWEQVGQRDAIARHLPRLGVVLQAQEAWDDLESLAQQGLKLSATASDPALVARHYGFLADVALHRQQWRTAQNAAQTALDSIAEVPEPQQRHRGWYLWLLAQSIYPQGQPDVAIAHLETAKQLGVRDTPQVYIGILETLRSIYFEQKQYLEAFRVKQERRSIQQQYGLRAFVGASRLKPSPSLAAEFTERESIADVTREIEAFGRQTAINELVSRIASPQHKLTVIYGQSGVGKSSLVEAGLVPTLKNRTIGIRDPLPVPVRFYTNWVQELGKKLAAALQTVNIDPPMVPWDSPEEILQQLQQAEDRNFLVVLIFDQFEEFFFVSGGHECDRFFQFLHDCLNLSFVNVILSLREDYLHLLLRGSRQVDLDVINNNILDKNILYYVGNLDSQQAKSIILSLSQRSRLAIESQLVDKLVYDLARESREVRPIELQVVGAQLQSDGITTLEQYLELGSHPKETLVQRYLQGVVTDCGDEQQRAAELVLYLLTDEHDTRPLRTRAELEEDLQELAMGLTAEASKLDLVLRIFVESGLVFLLKESPADRYQLVHDYLVTFIRQQQEPKIKELVAELETERQQRQYAEALRQQAEADLQHTEAAKQQAELDRAQAEAERDRAQEETQLAAEQLKQTKAKRDRAERDRRIAALKTKRQIRIGAAVLMCSIVLASGTSILALRKGQAIQRAQEAKEQLTAENQQLTQSTNKLKQEKEKLEKQKASIEQTAKTEQEKLQREKEQANREVQTAIENEKLARVQTQTAKEKQQEADADLNEAQQNLDSLKQEQEKADFDRQQAERETATAKQQLVRSQQNLVANQAALEQSERAAQESKRTEQEAVDRSREASDNLQKTQQELKQAQDQIDRTQSDLEDMRFVGAGLTYAEMGLREQAFNTFQQVLNHKPDNVFALAGRGEVYRQMERYDDALKDFDQAIELDSNFAYALASRGTTYSQMGNYGKALHDLNLVLESDPENVFALSIRGATYLQMGRYQEALADVNSAIELNSLMDWTINLRGAIYYWWGQHEKALENFNLALSINPNLAVAIANRGETYLRWGRYQDALTELDRAINLDPNSFYIYNRALAYLALGESEKGQVDLESAIEKAQEKYNEHPERPENIAYLALYYLANGQNSQAESLYRELLSGNMSDGYIRLSIIVLDDLLSVFPDHSEAQSIQQVLQSHLELDQKT